MSDNESPKNPMTIIDLGAHRGSDIQYYLNKADFVVAVEANPELCEIIRKNHSGELSSGALVVENCVVTTNDDYRDEGVDFFIHNEHTYQSQFEEPEENRRMLYTKHHLKCRSIGDLIAEYGVPHYLKIDLEGYDSEIIESLFNMGVFPDYISCEIHTQKSVDLLLSCNEYVGFKLLNGSSISTVYSDVEVETKAGRKSFSFRDHMAGPFGSDLKGVWLGRRQMKVKVLFDGLGWRDLHASRVDHAMHSFPKVLMTSFGRMILRKAGSVFPRKTKSEAQRFLDKIIPQ